VITLHSRCIGSSTFVVLDKKHQSLYNQHIATLIGVNVSIEIKNLTAEQVEMLDIIWSFDSAEEYLNWYHLLDAEDQEQADVLQHMIILETMDEMLEEVSNNYTDIKSYLKKFML